MTKQNKRSISKIGNTAALKTGETEGSKANNWLKQMGVIDAIESVKPQESEDYLEYLKNTGTWLKWKKQELGDMLELYASVGGTAANYMARIQKLEMDLFKRQKQLEDEGISPMDDKMFLDWNKELNKMILEANKLNLDINKAKADYTFKKSKQGNDDGDSLW